MFVFFAGFAIARALLVHERLEPSFDLLIIVTAAGVTVVIAVGMLELLSALQRIDFQRYGVVGALGFAAWLAWIAGVSAIGLSSGAFTPVLGWLGLAAVAAGLLVVGRFAADRRLIRGERSPGLAEMAPLLAVFLAIVAWLVWLGLAL